MMKFIKLSKTKQTIAVSTRKRGSASMGNRFGAVEHAKESLFHLRF